MIRVQVHKKHPATLAAFDEALLSPWEWLDVEYLDGVDQMALDVLHEAQLHEPEPYRRIALVAGLRAYVSLLAGHRAKTETIVLMLDGTEDARRVLDVPLYFDPGRCWDYEVRAVSFGQRVVEIVRERIASREMRRLWHAS